MTRTWLTYPVPLQGAGEPAEMASVRVPVDLTRTEAERIKEMLDALVLTVEREKSRTTVQGQPATGEHDDTPVAMRLPYPAGAHLIAIERERQMEAEGFTPEHDDDHCHGELVDAAILYARHVPDMDYDCVTDDGRPVPSGWPWDSKWWKPDDTSPVRNLVKAGALIAAEIDRVRRNWPEDT